MKNIARFFCISFWFVSAMPYAQSLCSTAVPCKATLIPGLIQAEDYANFYDQTLGNVGKQYRNDSVDIQDTADTGGGYNIGWIDGGEWFEFPINVTATGNYEASVRVASLRGGGMFTLEVDGRTLGKTFIVDSTDAWQNWATLTTTLGNLTAGSKTLRVQVQAGAFNVNWIELKQMAGTNNTSEGSGTNTSSTPAGTAAAPGVVLNDATFTTSGATGWFTSNNPSPVTTGGDFLTIRLDDPKYGNVYKVIAPQTLQLGEALALTFDVARTAPVRGDLAVSLVDTTNSSYGYGFNASLGTAVNTVISRTQYQARQNTYAGGHNAFAGNTVAPVVGTNIASDFDTYKFRVERIAKDALWFQVSQSGVLLQSTIKTYDGTDQAADQLHSTFNRIVIGWGDTQLSQPSLESIKIDNVKLQKAAVILPEKLWVDYITKASSRLTNWSAAGYLFGDKAIPNAAVTHNVTRYGAVANDGKDDTLAVQKAIDAAGNAGGGVVFFPAGQFDFQKVNNNGHALSVTKPNVVLRGSGSGASGTLLKQWTRKPTGAGLERWYLIDVRAPFTADAGVKLAVNAEKNSRRIKLVNNSQAIKAGDILRLELISTLVDGARDPRINLKYAAPASYDNGVIESRFLGFNGFTVHSLTVQAKSVAADGLTIDLWQPLPGTFLTEDNARVRKYSSTIYFVGVEKLKILGAFDDATYTHHGSWEKDYGWNGIGFKGVVHGWVRDVVLEKMTEDIIVEESMNCTIENIKTLTRGHLGISLLMSYYNLVRNYEVAASRSHFISTANQSGVNVWSGINNTTGKHGEIDFHGSGRSYSNLVENSTNMRVSASGDPKNLLHAGQFNTFWNIEVGLPVVADDFFSQGVYNYANNGVFPLSKQHQHFPKSIVVGVGRQGAAVNVGDSKLARDDQWLYVNSPGPSVYPQSLYNAQKKLGK
jgi:hypothetical protein